MSLYSPPLSGPPGAPLPPTCSPKGLIPSWTSLSCPRARELLGLRSLPTQLGALLTPCEPRGPSKNNHLRGCLGPSPSAGFKFGSIDLEHEPSLGFEDVSRCLSAYRLEKAVMFQDDRNC